MRKKLSRILALILAVSISLNSLPMAAFATNSETTVPETEITETVDDTKEDPTDPVDDSTDDPAEDPAGDPVEDPAGDSVEDPADDPVEDPADDPVDDPADDPVEDPADDPVDDPADDPVDDPAEKTFEHPADAVLSEDGLYYTYADGTIHDAETGELIDMSGVATLEEIQPQADEYPKIVIAGSDYQNTNGGLFSSGASTDAYAIMSQIKEDYASAYGFLFGGDYYAHNTNTTTESTNGKNQLKNEVVDVLYPDMADDTQIYIQGNHDADSLTTNGTLATSGAHDTDYYGVYVINEKDYMWYNDNQATIKNTASALESYLDEKLQAGYSKPIFVLSHLPLHFSNRTIREGDGKYAKYIYDVLDEAGKNDLNIIFMYGHNHSTSYYEEYLGNAAVYLAEGDTIYVANEGSQSSCFSDTLNFTYMNYGFTGYLTGTAADGALTMTVFEIYEDEVKVKRYDKSDVHNLKSAGTNGSTPSGATYNTTVYTSPQTIKLTTPEAKATFTNNGVTVTAGGITGITASKSAEPTYNSSLYSGYEEYTVSAEGYETGKTAAVTIALTDGDFDTTRPITVKFPDGHTEDVAVTNGTITVDSHALGKFTLMQKVQTEIEIPGDSGSDNDSTGSANIWRQVTSITAGKKYLLVNYGYNASGVSTYAIGTKGHTTGATVSVLTDSEGRYIDTTDTSIQWTAVASSRNGFVNLQNVSSDDYLVASSSTSEADLTVSSSITGYAFWNTSLIAVSGSEPSIAAYQSTGNGYRFVRYSAGESGFVTYPNGNTEKNDNWIALFEQTSEGGSSGGTDAPTVDTEGGNWVTITEPTGGTTTYIYTQAESITGGQKYVIVGNNHAIALQGTTSMGTQSVTISGTTMTSTTALTEWTFSDSSSGTIYNGTRYLRYNNSAFSLSTSSTTFTITDNGSNFRIRSGNYSFYYDGEDWTRSGRNTAEYVRLYQLTDTTTTGGTAGLYYKLDGELTYTVPYGTSEAVALAKVKEGIAIKYATKSDYSDEATFADDGTGMTWKVVDYDGNTAGEYAVNISYNGTLLGTAKIVVNAKPAGTAQVTIDSDNGIVRQNAGVAALTGNKLTVTYQNGTTETVNVTVGMVKNADGTAVDTSVPGTYTGLKVVYTYNGVEYTICNNYTLTVRENTQNNYPEYPDEGSVKVNKTAIGVDFQSSGIAQVEISASGVPSKKGVDVIVMVDTSSSMKRGAGTNEEVSAPNRRIDFLQTAIANLIREFQAVGDDGEQLDVNVAIAEFNGYSFISGEDEPSDSGQQGASNVAEVFTGDRSKTAGAFVPATSISNPDAFASNIGEHSGTNYDYAFDTVYRLGSAINAKNEENGVERDLFVIFMSDGAPYGYNYYGSGTTDTWDDYLNGKMTLNSAGRIVDDTGVYLKGNTHFYRTDGKHWMAEAVKGTTDQTYMVIDPTDSLGTDATAADVKVYEDAGIILTEGETSYFRMVSGLGAEVHSIGFCLYDDDQNNGNIVYATTQKDLMQRLASVDEYGNVLYHETESGEDLNDIFCEIASKIAYAANNARFVDQMGDDYNLQLETSTYTTVVNGVKVEKTLAPVIEIGTYPIYTRADFINGKCTEEQIGMRTGSFKLTEAIKFSDDGKKAYSSLIDVDGDGKKGVTVNTDGTYTINDTDDNILGTDGVIYAKSFIYNTNPTDVSITGVDIPTGKTSANLTTGTTTVVPAETFYWKMGTVQTSELAMRYYVYLEGSMEGTREAGSYPTNEFATLYYDNYVDNPCYKDTVSPVMAWKSANVSYAFYLVDENGNIIVNQTTGATGTFANKIAVTNPVVYEEIYLNNTDQVQAIEVEAISDEVLPKYYTLYDSSAIYEVTINSNSTGNWNITKGTGKVASTYVTNYKTDNASAYSNELSNATIGDDYTHTTVWFAVVWKVGAHPDTVVVDYGLPVDITVLSNDMFGESGKLEGIGAYSDSLNINGYDTTLANGFGTNYTGTYGTAEADTTTGKVRYTLNTMQMNGYEKFAYAVNYTGNKNAGYYYDTVTVIPATTIYYEDGFLTYTASNTEWVDEGTAIYGATQGEDRPGKYSLTDANNIYGYDAVNLGMSTFSLGTAQKVHVGANSFATAGFTFTGTGFDVISMTSNTTGVIAVQVADAAGNNVVNKVVNTYYGYTFADGKWVATPDTANALYQVPVLQVNGLTYGQYTVKITATYASALDKTTSEGYDLYIDAIRIYDPANNGATDNDTVIEDAYKADGEGWPSYIELRNKLIDPNGDNNEADGTLGNADTTTIVEGLVFIDGDASVGDAQISDYISYGPNNEVYIAPGQRVAFMLDTPANIANVHLGIKSADGKAGTYTITNIARESNTETGIDAGESYHASTSTISTTTDMYYDITGFKGDIIVISNTGDKYNTTGVISLTNIKSTYKSAPVATASDDGIAVVSAEDETTPVLTRVYMTRAAANLTLRSLNTSEPVEDTTGSSGNVDPTPDQDETPAPEVVPTPAPTPDAGEDTTKPGVNEDVTTPDDSQTGDTTPEEDKTEGETPDNENQTPGTDSEQTTPDEGTEEEPMGFFAWLISMIVGFFKNLFGGLFN